MVAFQAMATADQAGVGTNQNIIFEKVIINIGNGYYPHLGTFIVPRNGIYQISTTVCHMPQGTFFNGAIVHQGNNVAYLFGMPNEYEHATQTVLIQAKFGDEINVRNVGPANENIYGRNFTTFTGHLVWET